MVSGSASPGVPRSGRRSGGLKFKLFGLLLIFGLGFYAGVSITKSVSAGGPIWLQHLFGLPLNNVANAPHAAAVTANAPAQPPVTATTQPVQNSVNPPANVPVNPVQSPVKPNQPDDASNSASTAPKSNQSDTQETAASGQGDTFKQTDNANTPNVNSNPPGDNPQPDQSFDLPALVQRYNAMLHRVQDSQQYYATIHRKLADSKLAAQAVQPLLDQETRALDDMSDAAKRAQILLTTIKAQPKFAVGYSETKPCLSTDKVPTRLLDLNLDQLKFIQPKTQSKK